MSNIDLATWIAASPEECFDLSLNIDAHIASIDSSREWGVAGVTSGLIGLGEEVTWEAKHFGIKWLFTSRITELDRPRSFVDEQMRGPFASWHHRPTFEEHGRRLNHMIETITITQGAGGIYVEVHVQPGARQPRVVGAHDRALKIAVAARPVDGRANEAVVKVMAGVFGIPASDVSVVAGHTARRKRLFAKSISPNEARSRIRAALEADLP